MPDTTILALIAGAALLALVAGFASLRRRKRQRADAIGELPAYLYLASHTPGQPGRNGGTTPDIARLAAGNARANGDTPRHGAFESAPPRGNGGGPALSLIAHRTAGTAPILGWAPAADETVRLLPGRLEPVSDDAGQEIRFVQRPGMKRFTFGRSRGPAYEHVQLRVASASRMHAWMEFADGRWRIGALSATNAVLVNGAPLDTDDVRTLEDGDRIDMGEAAFVFRQPTLRIQAPVLSRRPTSAQSPDNADAAGVQPHPQRTEATDDGT